jgi:hypothetical protein
MVKELSQTQTCHLFVEVASWVPMEFRRQASEAIAVAGNESKIYAVFS